MNVWTSPCTEWADHAVQGKSVVFVWVMVQTVGHQNKNNLFYYYRNTNIPKLPFSLFIEATITVMYRNLYYCLSSDLVRTIASLFE
jgi:hypothetical protein